MGQNQNNEKPTLDEVKSAIKRMSDIHRRIAALMMRRFATSTSQPSLGQAIEKVESRVETFSKALSKFVRLRRMLHMGLQVLGNNLKTLEDAGSVTEISTLIGFTVLSDQREYNEAATQLTKSYDTELLPVVPELTNLLNVAAKANDASKMLNKLLNYDATTREDDLIKMMLAIRDLKIAEFEKLYQGMKQRIEAEEQRQLK